MFWPGKSCGQRAEWAIFHGGGRESDTTERLNNSNRELVYWLVSKTNLIIGQNMDVWVNHFTYLAATGKKNEGMTIVILCPGNLQNAN